MVKKMIYIAGWLIALILIDYSTWMQVPGALTASLEDSGGQAHILAEQFFTTDNYRLKPINRSHDRSVDGDSSAILLLAFGLIGLTGIHRSDTRCHRQDYR